MTPSPELLKLQQSVRESRINITREYTGLLSDLDIQKRFTESVRHHPLRWIGGAATAGLIATLFGGRKRSASKSAITSAASTAAPNISAAAQGASTLSKISWVGGALEIGKLLYPILRPVVVEFVTNAAQAGLAKRSR